MTGTNTAPQVLHKTPDEDRLVSVDFGGKLDAGETLTGVPTAPVDHTIPASATTLTTANVAINTTELIINGRTVPIGEAVQFLASAGGIDSEYIIKVSAASTSAPAQALVGFVRIAVDSD